MQFTRNRRGNAIRKRWAGVSGFLDKFWNIEEKNKKIMRYNA